MNTVWDYSLTTEANRILHIAHGVATGFFRINNFLVMPYGKSKADGNIVTLPDLPYLSIPRFWERSARIDVRSTPSIKMTVPPDLTAQTQRLISSLPQTTPPIENTRKTWSKFQDKIIKQIYNLIPSQKNSVKKIVIWPTKYGTTCSFSICNQAPHTIYIWLREDQGVSSIVEAILTSLTRKQIFDSLGGLWQESEIIVDWLLTYSPLNKLIKEADPDFAKTLTIKNTRTKQKAGLLEESAKFLQKIGTPTASPHQVDTSNFSVRENQLFQLLLSRSPNIVTFDELSSTDPNNFSLYAISKSIQRLRDKLEQNGVSGSFIQTKRGEGYLLVN